MFANVLSVLILYVFKYTYKPCDDKEKTEAHKKTHTYYPFPFSLCMKLAMQCLAAVINFLAVEVVEATQSQDCDIKSQDIFRNIRSEKGYM